MCGCNKAKVTPRPAAVARASVVLVPTLATVDTSVWGASLWNVLHAAAELSDGPQWNAILSDMTTGLPCPDCSAHYNAWYKGQFPPPAPQRAMYRPGPFMNRRRQQPVSNPVIRPLPIKTRILALHNEVNQRLGKSVWTEEQLTALYSVGERKEWITYAISTLQTLNGIIGTQLYNTLLAFLQSL